MNKIDGGAIIALSIIGFLIFWLVSTIGSWRQKDAAAEAAKKAAEARAEPAPTTVGETGGPMS